MCVRENILTIFPLFCAGLVCKFADGVLHGDINKKLVNNGEKISNTECAELVREKYPHANAAQWHISGVCMAALQQTSIENNNNRWSGYFQSCLFDG